jgi:UDP-N-acetylmuramoyl-tripeptide--D-alanyl-D-alanine ligase
MKARKAIFLDRDGVINVDVGYTHKIEDLAFEQGAIEGLKKLSGSDYLLIITTGQSGIGRGKYTEGDYNLFMGALLDELKRNDVRIDVTYFCPHHPEKAMGDYKKDCECRKPKTGMIAQSKEDFRKKGIEIDIEGSYVIGDKTDDIKMGENAGCKTILVMCRSGKQGKDNHYQVSPTHVAQNLDDAADWILRQG